jgi:hypothetical protein
LRHFHKNAFHSFTQAVAVCEVKYNLILYFKDDKREKAEKAVIAKQQEKKNERESAYHLKQNCSVFSVTRKNLAKFSLRAHKIQNPMR